MTMLYSVNLRIMSNKANVSFLKIPTLFSKISDSMYEYFPSVDPQWGIAVFLIIFVFVLKALLDLFYHTDLGLTMGALGANPQLPLLDLIYPFLLLLLYRCEP